MSPLPGLYGANSSFMTGASVPHYANGVVNLARLRRPTVVGYMYGGIFSTVAETSFNPVIAATQTGASNQVFQIVVTPTRRSG